MTAAASLIKAASVDPDRLAQADYTDALAASLRDQASNVDVREEGGHLRIHDFRKVDANDVQLWQVSLYETNPLIRGTEPGDPGSTVPYGKGPLGNVRKWQENQRLRRGGE